MAREVLLTTFDNPYNPSTQFTDWYAFDSQRYNSCSYLARIAHTSPELSDADYASEVERAIDEICALHPSLYKKVVIES